MNPARSPRFQSAAERCSMAAISCGGLPRGIAGARQAVTVAMKTAYGARRTICLLNVAAGASRRDAPADGRSEIGLAAAFLLRGLLLFGRFLLLSLWLL